MNDFDPVAAGAGLHDDLKDSDSETCAKRVMPALFAWFLLISASSTYFTLVFPEFLDSIGHSRVYFFALATAHGAVFLFVIINFVISTFMDPGRFPKVDVNEVMDEFKQNSGTYKNVLINDVNVRMKWCTTCQFFRPPRSSHCGVCNACIDTMDHHCPWICNCIARRNYKYFLQFLLSLTVHMLIILGFSIALVFINKENLTQLPIIVAVLMIIIVGVLIIPIGGLTGFHVILVSRGRTTNEQVTGKFRTGVNPFDLGFCTNWARTLCSSAAPSYVRFVSEKRKRIEYMETMLALEAAAKAPVKVKVKHTKVKAGDGNVKRSFDYDNYDDLDVSDVHVAEPRSRSKKTLDPPPAGNKIKYSSNLLSSTSSAGVTPRDVEDLEADEAADESVHMLRSHHHHNGGGTGESSSKKKKKSSSSSSSSRPEQYEMQVAAQQRRHDQYYEEREQQTLENGQSVWVNRDTLRAAAKQKARSSGSGKKTQVTSTYDEANFTELPPKYHDLPPVTPAPVTSNHQHRKSSQPPASKKYTALNGNRSAAAVDKHLSNKLLMQEQLNANNQFMRNNSYVKAAAASAAAANVDSGYQPLSIPVHYQAAAADDDEAEKRAASSKKSKPSRVSQGQAKSQRSSSGHRHRGAAPPDDDHLQQQVRLNSLSDDPGPDYNSYEITV